MCFRIVLLFASHKSKVTGHCFNYVDYMHCLLTGKASINMFMIPVHFFYSVILYAVIAVMYTYSSCETIAKFYWSFFSYEMYT